MAEASQRLVAAVAVMAPEPSDDVLELGCGHGVAASLICERLNDGRLTAIDRSARMIALAARRNAEHVAAGRARFEAVAVEKAELGEDAFDKLFAVDVAAFWRPGTGALTAARRLLRPGGTLHPSHHAPGWRDREAPASFVATLTATLAEGGFAVEAVKTTSSGPAVSVHVRARA